MSSKLYFNVSVDIHGGEQEIYYKKKNQNVIHCQLCISNCLFLIRVNGKIGLKIGKTVDLSSFVKELCPN